VRDGRRVIDAEHCYRAACSRDGRFDGVFFLAVTTTRIYCRPSCPATPPRRDHLVFYPTAAAAQEDGYRACKRCRPDAAPGSSEWDRRGDLAGRAMRLIADGLVDREGVAGLASYLGYGERQLRRQLVAELGAAPLALARARRVQSARALLDSTDLAVTDVAFASGFGSVRQFNDTIQSVYALTPSEIRRGRAAPVVPGPGTISLRLAYRPPIALGPLFSFLADRALEGVEEGDADSYRRVLRLPHGTGVVTLSPRTTGRRANAVGCELALEDLRDLGAAVERCRRLLDLDADPVAVGELLGRDPSLAPLERARPGLRVPGHVDGAELAVRAVLGQQVSVRAATALAARLVRRFGKPLGPESGALTHAFPEPSTIAAASPEDFGMPAARGRALVALCSALADGRVDLGPGADRVEARHGLLRLPGIGPWTAEYIAMRALHDPDAFLPGDLGVRRALARLGLRADPAGATARAEAWRPWRAYGLMHLWAAASDPPVAAGGPRTLAGAGRP